MSEMNHNEALIGSAAFFVMAPGTVAGVVPWLITHWRFGEGASLDVSIAGGVLIALSLALLTAAGLFIRGAVKAAVTDPGFALEGGLVVRIDPALGGYDEARGRGIFRAVLQRVRNPMYVAVTALIFGQSLLFASADLIAYGVTIALAFFMFVIHYEEPRLARDFPDEYRAYFDNVPRWRPRLTPWRPAKSEGRGGEHSASLLE